MRLAAIKSHIKISEPAFGELSKLEVENHGLGIYPPASTYLLAERHAAVFCLVEYPRPYPLPKLFDALRTLVRITVLARGHFILTTPAAMRSRMDVVGCKHEPFFHLGVGFLSPV
jgi:hypothetical protein